MVSSAEVAGITQRHHRHHR